MSRPRSKISAFAMLSLSLAACAQLVGITDTAVTRNNTTDAGPVAQSGAGGSTLVSMAPGGTGGGGAGGSGAPSTTTPGAGGTAGMGGTPPMSMPDAGPSADAGETPCANQATRCGVAGREQCNAGVWQASACPVNTPTCEGEGQCVVRGPTMVNVGGAFFIDSTEVTVAQYRQFLTAKNGDVSGQIAVCSWNQSYYEAAGVMDPDNFPISQVDWCDAAAYCAWAGKRMCGSIGGGSIARADIFDETKSQWFVACGGGGFHPNENSETAQSTPCNSISGALRPVSSTATCEGFYPGLFDMVGNVAEWVDNCTGTAGAMDPCFPMGGGIFDKNGGFCDEAYGDEQDPWYRNSKADSAGIRCCAG